MKFFLFFINCLCITSNAFAMFCPNNFNSINLGDSLESVLQTCGMPSAKNEIKQTPSAPAEWIYYKPLPLNQGNIKISFVFNENDQLINIDVATDGLTKQLCEPIASAIGSALLQANCKIIEPQHNVSMTQICGAPIKAGDNKKTVENICGKPSFVNQSQTVVAETNTLTELRYDGNQSISLLFLNGSLQDRRLN